MTFQKSSPPKGGEMGMGFQESLGLSSFFTSFPVFI